MTSGVGEDPGQPGHLDRDSAFFDDFAFRGGGRGLAQLHPAGGQLAVSAVAA
jgi:hypothetical protein